MNTYTDKTAATGSNAIANHTVRKNNSNAGFEEETIIQPALQKMANESAQVKQLRAVQQLADHAPSRTKKTIQRFTANGIDKVDGKKLRIQMAHQANRIDLIDISDPDETKGRMSGYITYSSDKEYAGVLFLNHFESTPPRLGIGSLLLYKFALVAREMNIKTIWVPQPAMTAMEAYIGFGAKPFYPDQFWKKYQQIKEQIIGEEKEAEYPNMTVDLFIKEESEEAEQAAKSMARYRNPKISKEESEEKGKNAREKHLLEHAIGDGEKLRAEQSRVTMFKAFAGMVSYDVSELISGTLKRCQASGWDIQL